MIGKFIHIRVKEWHIHLYLHFYSAPLLRLAEFPLITSIEHAIIPHNQYYVVKTNRGSVKSSDII